MSIINNDMQAIILLTLPLARAAKDEYSPLTPTEWNRLADWLQQKKIKAGDLLLGEPGIHLRDWNDKRCPVDRILFLLGRGVALGIAMEKWQRAGIWILSKTDVNYPDRLKDRLKENAPPILYGCGNQKLLNTGGVAVVGSRKATEEDLKYANELGKKMANSGKTVISGGARGIDESSMSGAMQTDGTVVGILADSLLRACTSQRYRQAIVQKNVVLISPYSPETPFNVGNAMARNKLIYCMADQAVVVHSGREGGTWNGALENLKKKWVPLLVKHTVDSLSGNNELVKHGGQWLPDNYLSGDAGQAVISNDDKNNLYNEEPMPVKVMSSTAQYENKKNQNDAFGKKHAKDDALHEHSFYELFCSHLKKILLEGPQTQKVLEEKMKLTNAQAKIWLKKAQEDGLIKKKSNPVKYVLADETDAKHQTSLF
jgi:predicted Rossmann fold nucleotide-binding protein DprA/Smf involved in DNA uptake